LQCICIVFIRFSALLDLIGFSLYSGHLGQVDICTVMDVYVFVNTDDLGDASRCSEMAITVVEPLPQSYGTLRRVGLLWLTP